MKTCTKCGDTKPRSAFHSKVSAKDGLFVWCKACRKAYTADYYLTNRAKILTAAKMYGVLNREQLRAASRRYYYANRSKCLKQSTAWRKANLERMRALISAWALANPEARRAGYTTRRAKKRAAGGSFRANDIKILMALQKGKCPICAISLERGYHIDHVVPLNLGGSNDKTNLQLLCPLCNCRKGAKHPVEFMQSQGHLL